MNWEKTYVEGIESLLAVLRLPPDMAVHAETLHARLSDVAGAERLHSALRDLVDIVIEMRLREQAERQELSAFLQTLGEQLEALERGLMVTEQQTGTGYQIGRKEEQALERQVEEIESRLRTASSVDQVRFTVMQRLAIIHARLDDSRGKQASQFAALQGQLGKLGLALRRMEQESLLQRGRLEGRPRPPMVDAAIGVANRDAFELRVQQEYARWRRYGMPLVLMLLSFDRCTPPAGLWSPAEIDAVLRAAAGRLSGNLRETDFLARHGPTQFAVLMPGVELPAAEAVAERLCAPVTAMAANGEAGGLPAVSVSHGLAALQAGDDTAALLVRAFTALARHPLPMDTTRPP